MVVVLPEPLTPTTRMTNGLRDWRSTTSGCRARRENFHDRLAQRGDQRVDVRQLLARHALAQPREDVLRGLDADVRRQQPRFELFERGGVDPPAAEQLARDRG